MRLQEIDRELYITKYGDKVKERYGLDAGDVWDYYHENIYWALPLIAEERSKELKPTYEQIRVALYLNRIMWRACKATFKGLKRALRSKEINMKLKAQLDLQREIRNGANAKMLEMQLTRYDDEYKPKGKEVDVKIPDLKINYMDASVTPDELAKKVDEEE